MKVNRQKSVIAATPGIVFSSFLGVLRLIIALAIIVTAHKQFSTGYIFGIGEFLIFLTPLTAIIMPFLRFVNFKYRALFGIFISGADFLILSTLGLITFVVSMESYDSVNPAYQQIIWILFFALLACNIGIVGGYLFDLVEYFHNIIVQKFQRQTRL